MHHTYGVEHHNTVEREPIQKEAVEVVGVSLVHSPEKECKVAALQDDGLMEVDVEAVVGDLVA